MSPRALLPWVLGPAWGILAAAPWCTRARRVSLAARAAAVPRLRVPRRRFARVRLADVPALRRLMARRAEARHDRVLAREIPIMADVLGVAVSAGCTPYLAVVHAGQWAPPTAARHLRDVIDAVELGAGFVASLDALAVRVPPLRDTCTAVAVAVQAGSPLAPGLARIADEARRGARHRAEAHARRVSVRLLFPLVFLVLPAFVLLTVVPGIAEGIRRP